MKNNNRFTNTMVCILLGVLFVSLSCKNITEPPVLPEARAAVTFSVSENNGRTVLPNADMVTYRLFGGKTGADEEELAEIKTGTTTLSLETGTWHFTLNGYNTAGDIVLQGTAPNITLTSGTNKVVFDLAPFTTGKGNARITVHFPDYMGITKVTATGDLPEKSADIAAKGDSYTWEQNDIDAGHYFVSFALYKGSEKVSVVSEMVMVVKGLTSEKSIALSGGDLSPSLYTKAEGTTLTAQLNWLDTNAVSGDNYLVEVTANESIAPRVLEYTGKSDISVTLIGLGAVRTVSLSSNGSMFTVKSGVTLVLGSNITLKGRSSNTASLVYINDGGRLLMGNGAVITGNEAYSRSSSSHGGGVYVDGGTFTMSGGEITGNTVSSSSDSSDSYGGGVYVSSGTFTMDGGEIMGNTASSYSSYYSSSDSYGGGVYVSSGTFTMDGGEITGNTASSSYSSSYSHAYGGGVYVDEGTFTMSDGEITGNNAANTGDGVYMAGGTFTMSGGEITGNKGQGVYVAGGTFTMSGGEITGNKGQGVHMVGGTFTMDGGEITGNVGQGVYVAGGTFTMSGGEITGNTASDSSTSYDSSSYGGGVYVGSRGTFTMSDGEITGNTVSSSSSSYASSYGGGVYVGGGTFTMDGGEITGNTASSSTYSRSSSYGGGVYVSSGTFTMSGGEITGNTVSSSYSYSYAYGGGVYVGGGTFTMSGGEITGNTVSSSDSYGGGVYVGSGTFTMNGGEITGNTVSSYASSYGGGVYVDEGTFTMNGGEITGNTVSSSSSSYGGGVCVGSGTFTMNGGEITGNTVSSYASSYGGGVYVDEGTFTKTGGIITGYADDPVNGNVVKDASGSVQSNRGHAVYTGSKQKETTAGPTTELFCTGYRDSAFWNGSWDDTNDMSLSSTAGWSNHYIPVTANGELWYSFTVTNASTYYIWWNDKGQGSGKTGDIKVTAQYSDGTIIFTDVDSAYTTPQSFTASKGGMVRVKVTPSAAGTTGTFGIVMRTENVRP